MPIAACSTVRTVPVEIAGFEPLAVPCSDQPAALSDAEVQALVQAMPTPAERERKFWSLRDADHRSNEICERDRADKLAALIARNNQLARTPH